MKKLIPAIVMLLVSAVVLSTASYAWFSTTQSVTAEGMSVKATAPSSILISGFTGDNTTTTDGWTEFSSNVTFTGSTALLSPTSSKDGINFYVPEATDDVAGAMKYNTLITEQVNGTDDTVVTYSIKLKNDAPANEGAAVDICLEALSIPTGETAKAIDGAIRVAFIVDGVSKGVYCLQNTTAPVWVYVPEQDADNNNNIVYKTRAQGPLTKAAAANASDWTSVATGTAPGYANVGDVIVEDLAPQSTVEVTIVIWFEGQDSRCVSANSGLTSAISMKFGKVAAPAASESGSN